MAWYAGYRMAQFGMVLCCVRNGRLQWCGYDMWSDDGIVGSRPSDVGTAFEQQQGEAFYAQSLYFTELMLVRVGNS